MLRVLAGDEAGGRAVVCGYVVDLKTPQIRKIAEKLSDLPRPAS
ncbi:MAG: hypothetical protein U0736_02545 [Gemmataceae bacterium]